ncbi:MAG: arsenate reductase-like glutaredoxin family protein [Planctomycetota bacterium]
MVNAAKEKINPEAATELLSKHTKVVVAQGKKVLTFALKDAELDEVLKVIIGRSGNLRAPSVTVGKKLVVGFNEEMYEAEVAS